MIRDLYDRSIVAYKTGTSQTVNLFWGRSHSALPKGRAFCIVCSAGGNLPHPEEGGIASVRAGRVVQICILRYHNKEKNKRESMTMASYRYERDIDPKDLVPDAPRTLTKAEARANWWHYHWYYVLLVACVVLAAGWFVVRRITEVKPDCRVVVIGRRDPDQAFLDEVEQKLKAIASDTNGDGKVKVTVKGIWLDLHFDDQDAATRQMMESSEEKLNADLYTCESMIFIVDDPTLLEARFGCLRLVDGTDPDEEGDTALPAEDCTVPLEDTALAGAGDGTTQWYVGRCATISVSEADIAAGDALWQALLS